MGANEPIHVNVRLVSATNRDLAEAIKGGTFRPDLYHRIKVISVRLPPLRERREDIPLLIDHFVREFAEQYGKPVPAVTAEARQALMGHTWPGNVRQLRNVVESMVVIDTDGELGLDDLADEDLQATAGGAQQATAASTFVGQPMEEIEAHYIAETLKLTEGNREEAARMLGIGERTLYRKLKEYGIS